MPNRYDEYEIRNALRQAENDRLLDQQSTELAGFIVALLAPVLIPLIFGLMALAIGFGVPFIGFMLLDSILMAVGNIPLAIFLGVILSLAFCFVDLVAIIYFFPKLRAGWKGGLILAYMILLLAVPWSSGAFVLFSMRDANGNLALPVNPATEYCILTPKNEIEYSYDTRPLIDALKSNDMGYLTINAENEGLIDANSLVVWQLEVQSGKEYMITVTNDHNLADFIWGIWLYSPNGSSYPSQMLSNYEDAKQIYQINPSCDGFMYIVIQNGSVNDDVTYNIDVR